LPFLVADYSGGDFEAVLEFVRRIYWILGFRVFEIICSLAVSGKISSSGFKFVLTLVALVPVVVGGWV